MANTKITLGNIADDAVGLDQLNISNSPSNGQALTYVATSNDLQWASVGVSGIDSSADATAITIDSSENVQFSGNVGIGVAPTHNFNLQASGTVEARFRSTDGDCSLQISSDTDEGQDSILEFTSGTSGRGRIVYDHNTTAASQKMIFQTGDVAVNAMTIDGVGRVLIGQESGDAFNDDSMLRIQRTGDRVFQQFKCDADQNVQILFGDVDDDVECTIQYHPSDQDLRFSTGNNSEAMRIDSSGRVLMGWTSSLSSSATLQVNSNAKIGNIFFQGDSTNSKLIAGNAEIRLSSLEFRGGGSGLDFDVTLIKTGVGFTNMFKVDSPSGDTFTNDGTISSLSDERIKTDINDLTDGLDIVKQLRPVTFKYNDTTEDEEGKKELGTADDTVRYGFIAQEVEAVAPHYVETSTRKINNEEVDDFKSMSTTRMIPMLFKAIQEQQTIIDDLKTRIETLESN